MPARRRLRDEKHWGKPRPQYYVQTGAAFENPFGMPVSEIRRYIENHSAENVAQVIYGKYVDHSGLVFTGELVSQLFTDDAHLEPIREHLYWDQERWWQARIEMAAMTWPDEYRFHVGVDLARKKDSTVITVLDTKNASVEHPARIVYWRKTSRVPWASIYADIGRAAWLFPGQMLVDRTGGQGDLVMEELESRYYCPYHHASFSTSSGCSKEGRRGSDLNARLFQKDGLLGEGICGERHWIRLNPDGYVFSTNSKPDLINNLQSLMGRGYDEDDLTKPFGVLRSPPIVPLQEGMGAYAWDDKKLDTDEVFSFALAAWSGLEDLPLPPEAGSIHGVEVGV